MVTPSVLFSSDLLVLLRKVFELLLWWKWQPAVLSQAMDCKLINVRLAEAEMLRWAHLSTQMEAHNYDFVIHLKRTLGDHLLKPQTHKQKLLRSWCYTLHVVTKIKLFNSCTQILSGQICIRHQFSTYRIRKGSLVRMSSKKLIAHDILGVPDQIFQGTVKLERYEEHIPIYSLAMSKRGAENEECLLQEDLFVLLPMTIKSPHLIFKDGVKQ